jgi:chromosome segregation ATPase
MTMPPDLSLVPPPDRALVDLLRVMASRHDLPGILDWLAVAELAWADPPGFARSFSALRDELQYALVHLFIRDPNPVAASMAGLLASVRDSILDDQLRLEVTEAARQILEQTPGRLAQLQDRRDELARQVEAGRARLEPGYDVQGEILRLEARLHELAGQAILRDDVALRRVLELEREIHLAEVRIRVLEHHDEPGRRAALAALSGDLAAATERVATLNEQCLEQEGRLSRARADLARRESDRLARETELASVEARIRDLDSALRPHRTAMDALSVQLEQLRSEQATLGEQRHRLEREQASLGATLEKERMYLADLEAAASQHPLADLPQRIQELMASLPRDQVDRLA